MKYMLRSGEPTQSGSAREKMTNLTNYFISGKLATAMD